MKTTVITSAIFAVGLLNLKKKKKKKKHEQMEGLVVFCHEIQRSTLATWGVSLGREMLE